MKVAGDATLSRPKSTDFRMISPQKCGSKWWDSDLIHSVAKSWESAVGMANMTFFRHYPPVSSKVARWYNHLSMGQFPASHVGLLVHRVHQIVIYGNTWYIFRCKVPKITEKNHWKNHWKSQNFIASLGDLAEVPNGGLQKRLAQAQLHGGATGIRLRARRRWGLLGIGPGVGPGAELISMRVNEG